MPANWGSFTAAMNSWFCGDAEGGEDFNAAGEPTAKKIADEYVLAISTSAGPIMNMYQSGVNKSLIINGFKTSFNTQFQAAGTPPEGVDLGMPNWIPAATGVVNSWLTATFLAMPAIGHGLATAPLTGGPTDHKLLEPGMAGMMPLAQAISDAFDSNDCNPIGGKLASGFADHMSMISGVYNGFMPNPAGTPPLIPQPPFPWFGVT